MCWGLSTSLLCVLGVREGSGPRYSKKNVWCTPAAARWLCKHMGKGITIKGFAAYLTQVLMCCGGACGYYAIKLLSYFVAAWTMGSTAHVHSEYPATHAMTMKLYHDVM